MNINILHIVADDSDTATRIKNKINKLQDENKDIQKRLQEKDLDKDRSLVLVTKRDKNRVEIDKFKKQLQIVTGG